MVSTATIAQYLEGCNFPCSRLDLINFAKDMNAPNDVLTALQQLPDRTFNSIASVWDAIGEVT